jgi:hypothetical protein
MPEQDFLLYLKKLGLAPHSPDRAYSDDVL